MNRLCKSLFFFIIFLLPTGWLLHLFAVDDVPLNKETFSSPLACSQCHQKIYEDWKESMHAMSVSDPIFQAVFLQAKSEGGEKTARLCLSCHSPTTEVTKDYHLKKPLSRDGVSCDFCHRIKNVELSKKQPFEIETNGTKYGPFKEVSSPAHEVSYSENHKNSELCAGCHEYKNPKGISILTTYSEWKAGPYPKEGVSCQTCHMPERKDFIVSGKVKPTEKYIHSHKARGGHSIAQVRKTIKTEIADIRRHGEKVSVLVKVSNIGSGHKVPTGMPSRKLVLKFRVKSPGQILYEDKRVYQKIVLKEDGSPIDRDDKFFTEGAVVASDNRILPRETREEHFSFMVPSDEEYLVSVSVSYLYEPLILQKTKMSIDLGQVEQILRVKK